MPQINTFSDCLSELASKPIFDSVDFERTTAKDDDISINKFFCEKCRETMDFTGKSYSMEKFLSDTKEKLFYARNSIYKWSSDIGNYDKIINIEECKKHFNKILNAKPIDFYFRAENVIIVSFICPRCYNRIYICYALQALTESSKFRITKIGEYPNQEAGRLIKFEKYKERFPEQHSLIIKAEKAYRNGLGSGAGIYIRKAYEILVNSILDKKDISRTKQYKDGTPQLDKKGKPKEQAFIEKLKAADDAGDFIPDELKEKSYGLFGELSGIIHAETSEEFGLKKYEDLRDIFTYILDDILLKEEKSEKIAKLK